MSYKLSDFKDDYSEDEDYYDFEDDLAFAHTLYSADNGNVEYMRVLGDMYSGSGHGVKTDYGKAIYWYQRAADCGDCRALLSLADILYEYDDRGVPHDYERAFSLYELAAEEGSAKALARLGIMYLYGFGTVADKKYACKLLAAAADKGDREACYEYALILRERGSDDWVGYMKKSADNSYGKACLELIFYFGDEMPDRQYIIYLTYASCDSAVGANAVGVCLTLAECYMNGYRTRVNRGYAKSFYTRAAELGSEEAKAALKKYFNIG